MTDRAGTEMEGLSAKEKYLPLVLVPIILLVDQLTKAILVANLAPDQIREVLGGFLRLWHRRNTAVSFSLGQRLPIPEDVRNVLFLFLSLAVVAGALVYYLKARDLTRLQRWLLAAIMAGGLGNDIDRVFRGSVVDWVDFKFYGIFGMARWPTFNVSDGTVVVAALLFVVSVIVQEASAKNRGKA